MKSVKAWWNRWWFEPIDPLPAAVCRMCVGTLLTVMFVALSPNWHRNYAQDGIISIHDRDLSAIHTTDNLSLFALTDPWCSTAVYWWVGIVAAVALTVGWRTRTASSVLFVLVMSMIHRNPYIVNGEELCCG